MVGPSLVLQPANMTMSHEALVFDPSTIFAHIPVTHPVFGEVSGSCVSHIIYPIMERNPNLLSCTLDFVAADTEALHKVFLGKVSPKVGTRVSNFVTPISSEVDENGKRNVGCQFSSQSVKKGDVAVIQGL